MMTKREILIDNKERIEEALSRVQLQPVYNGIRYEDECLILKCINDLLEGAINRAKEQLTVPRNNIAETLRNYANRDDVDVVFKCVLAEAAATIESLQKENANYVEMIAKLTLVGVEKPCE